METNIKPGLPATTWAYSRCREVAVDPDYYWQPMTTCPVNIKVQLLTRGGVAIYGMWNGKSDFYTDWAPLPKRRTK